MAKHTPHNPLHPKRLMASLTGGNQVSGWKVGGVAAGLLVVVGGVLAGVVVSQGSGPSVQASHTQALTGLSGGHLTPAVDPPPPVKVASVTPANSATGVGSTAKVTVSFSVALARSTPVPSLTPAVPGAWRLSSPSTLTFTPSNTYVPMAHETLVIPGGSKGVMSAKGARLTKGVVDSFTVVDGSTLRLQQLMSMLDYSPLSWTPSGAAIATTNRAAQDAAAFSAPAGTFAWRNHGWPTNLTSLWHPGNYNQLTKGLVMAFEADEGLTPDGVAGTQVWAALLHAVATHQVNTGGYNFALTNESQPEGLRIWHNGSEVFHSPANTGVAGAPTATGTFNVYERLRNQVMHGHNLDGSTYNDPVQYVAYFNGGDAVHYIPRSGYGVPQSLGCVELPLAAAAQAWPYLGYGTIMRVVN